MKHFRGKKSFDLIHELVQPLTVLLISLQYLHREHPHLSTEETRVIVERSLNACETLCRILKGKRPD